MTDRKPATAVRLLLSVLFCASLLANLSCASGKRPAEATLPTLPAPPPQPPEDYRLTMIAVGDNLIHRELINDARTETDDVFDFDKYYAPVAPLVRSADIAFINQETLIAGREFGYSGYPAFNGPKDIGRAIVRLGFDVVNHATNHTMDRGERAVFEVLDFWDGQKDVLALGINRSAEIREDVARNIIVKNGISVGFLAYTYGTNGIPLPKGKPFLVSLIDTEAMAREIDALRPLCDFLVVSMHWGNEYEHTPSARQQELARFLAARNVDLVIGHHPHVLQPLAAIPREGADPMICFFSLGNFLSAQNELPRILGGMMRVVIKKTALAPHTVTVEEAELLPLVTHYEAGYKNFGVYPLDKYTDDIASRHLLRPPAGSSLASYLKKAFFMLELRLPAARQRPLHSPPI